MEVTGRGQLLAVCKRNNVGKKPLVARSLSRLNNQQRSPTKPCTLSSRAFCRPTGEYRTTGIIKHPGDRTATVFVEVWSVGWLTLSHRLFVCPLLFVTGVVTRSGFTGTASRLDVRLYLPPQPTDCLFLSQSCHHLAPDYLSSDASNTLSFRLRRSGQYCFAQSWSHGSR
jgi:hypothetical protein